MDTKLGG